MNEFIDQFLLEAQELVEQATEDLLALEEAPRDADRLDSAFRAFHTLKGAAGIIDFAAMARALHAAEDVLGIIRSGTEQVTPKVISDCLTCLDQVVQWLDELRAKGEPPADAETSADAVIERFALDRVVERHNGEAAGPEPFGEDWIIGFLARHPKASSAMTAIRYTPDADCFFRGEDPLALIANLPGLLALECAPVEPSPELGEVDPFACRLTFSALVSASVEEVTALLRHVQTQIEARPLEKSSGGLGSEAHLPPAARHLLEAQLLLLAEETAEGTAGRLASAATVAANVLRHLGRSIEAARLGREVMKSQAAGQPRFLVAAIKTVLKGVLDKTDEAETPLMRGAQEGTARDLRVNVERIDALVRLTGELTVAKNSIGHAARLAQNGADPVVLASVLKEHHASLDRLVSELQRSVLGIRVLPLRHVFQRFPRLVRDLASSVNKPARLVTVGEATEADKAVVESLFEPLVHVIRNAMDHGIETSQERSARGKPPTATITLRGTRDGEHVVVEAEDDGRGIDVARVRAVASDHRIASPDVIATMTDDEVIQFIFAPGFSTTAEVTDLSGRGVGMDAVRTAVERLGGRVAIATRPGQGTIVRFILPFTVMMTRVMTVLAGGQTLGVPLDAVQETVRVARGLVLPVGAGHAFVHRDRTVPLIDLCELLGGTRDSVAPQTATVVIAAMGGQIAGLEVERLGERLDVMLKPVDGLLAGTRGIAGTTLLGDGRVLIVLDLQELMR